MKMQCINANETYFIITFISYFLIIKKMIDLKVKKYLLINYFLLLNCYYGFKYLNYFSINF